MNSTKIHKRNQDKYADIIDLPHHVSKKHRPMADIDRAAQFAPFAALTGFGSAIKKSGEKFDGESLVYEEFFDSI